MKWFTGSILFLMLSCGTQDYYKLPTFTGTQLNAVIEITAGTNLKIEYDHQKQEFLPDQRQGKDRYISFLGYPCNYGFIPSTFSDPERGGDGDALDILVLGTPLPSGTVQQVIPLGLLKLVDEEELDYKIIAIPADKSLQHIKAKNWAEFTINYPAVQEILGLWFTNYDRENETKIEGWGDQDAAYSEIKKWQIPVKN